MRCGGVTPASSDKELAEPNFKGVPVLNFGINSPWLAASLTAATLPRRAGTAGTPADAGKGSDENRTTRRDALTLASYAI